MDELIINSLVVHHWKEQKNNGLPFGCNDSDCLHKIETNETFYQELYPEGQALSYCLKCSAYFMSQAVNTLIEGWKA